VYRSDDDASSFVDALINSSVQHSPHFDWIVAHIGCVDDFILVILLRYACGFHCVTLELLFMPVLRCYLVQYSHLL
jgi:Integrator complex subunit 5 N-terminus